MSADAALHRGCAEFRLRQDCDRRDREDHGQHREGPPLESLHQVVPEERQAGLQQHDDDQTEQRADAEQRGSAYAPLTLLVANQPTPAVTDISTAGTALPLNPKASRPSTICGTPCSGPRADRK